MYSLRQGSCSQWPLARAESQPATTRRLRPSRQPHSRRALPRLSRRACRPRCRRAQPLSPRALLRPSRRPSPRARLRHNHQANLRPSRPCPTKIIAQRRPRAPRSNGPSPTTARRTSRESATTRTTSRGSWEPATPMTTHHYPVGRAPARSAMASAARAAKRSATSVRVGAQTPVTSAKENANPTTRNASTGAPATAPTVAIHVRARPPIACNTIVALQKTNALPPTTGFCATVSPKPATR